MPIVCQLGGVYKALGSRRRAPITTCQQRGGIAGKVTSSTQTLTIAYESGY